MLRPGDALAPIEALPDRRNCRSSNALAGRGAKKTEKSHRRRNLPLPAALLGLAQWGKA
jgi:hypothetical protein